MGARCHLLCKVAISRNVARRMAVDNHGCSRRASHQDVGRLRLTLLSGLWFQREIKRSRTAAGNLDLLRRRIFVLRLLSDDLVPTYVDLALVFFIRSS